MSVVTGVLQTRNQLITTTNVAKLQLGDNEHVTGVYTDSGAGSTLEAGLLMGKIKTTGKIVALDPTASDGSQTLFGVLFLGISESVVVAAAASETLTLINKGRVAEAKLVMPSGVTLEDAITDDVMDRTVRDYANALGLILEGGVELTQFDNQ